MVKENEQVQLLKDVKVAAKFYERTSFGVQILDEIFGGTELPGIVAGTTILFTGMPGAGKSTMSLQLADLLQRQAGRSVLYNNMEENIAMIKMRADRLGLGNAFCTSQFSDVNKLTKYCQDNGVEVLIVDSIQTMIDGDKSGHELLKSVVQKLMKLAETGVTTFAIGHITKGGQFAGPQWIKHAVDAHAVLKFNKENGNRVFELEKNRNGPASIPYEFMLSAQGLDFHQLVQSQEDAGANRASDRREQVKGLIIEKLKNGEKVSGYCFERFEVDCSGGYWRGMLAKAVKELAAQGYKMGTCRNGPSGNNRSYDHVVSAPAIAAEVRS